MKRSLQLHINYIGSFARSLALPDRLQILGIGFSTNKQTHNVTATDSKYIDQRNAVKMRAMNICKRTNASSIEWQKWWSRITNTFSYIQLDSTYNALFFLDIFFCAFYRHWRILLMLGNFYYISSYYYFFALLCSDHLCVGRLFFFFFKYFERAYLRTENIVSVFSIIWIYVRILPCICGCAKSVKKKSTKKKKKSDSIDVQVVASESMTQWTKQNDCQVLFHHSIDMEKRTRIQ